MKKIILIGLSILSASLVLLSTSASAGNLWKCSATDARGAYWYQYAATRAAAASGARARCRAGSYRPTCRVTCMAPTSKWRCVAVDNKNKTWYWVAASKSTAISSARTACIHNSTVGGCRVPPGSCTGS